MEKKLTKQEKKFIEIKAETGNGTKAAQEAFGIKDANRAGVKAHTLLRDPKIKKAIAESLDDSELLKVHKEGLHAKQFRFSPEGELLQLDDFATRHKYLDSAYKLKGTYAPEKHLNLNANAELTTREGELVEVLRELLS